MNTQITLFFFYKLTPLIFVNIFFYLCVLTLFFNFLFNLKSFFLKSISQIFYFNNIFFFKFFILIFFLNLAGIPPLLGFFLKLLMFLFLFFKSSLVFILFFLFFNMFSLFFYLSNVKSYVNFKKKNLLNVYVFFTKINLSFIFYCTFLYFFLFFFFFFFWIL